MNHHATIETYADLRKWAREWVRGEISSLIIFGAAGIGKTETFGCAIEDQYHVPVAGRISGFELFCRLSLFKDALILLDDTRDILRDRQCVNLLMQLGESKKRKTIQWNTASVKSSDDGGRQTSFETESRMCLLINRVDEDNEDLEPIFSRSITLLFDPSKTETHRYVGTFFPKADKESKEIYNYVGDHLSLIPRVDIRQDYVNPRKVYTMDWRDMLMQRWTRDKALVAAMKVMSDTSLKTSHAQVQAFEKLGGGTRNTYFVARRRLQKLNT